jgi:ABC-type multidrug transport system ATPase subunit
VIVEVENLDVRFRSGLFRKPLQALDGVSFSVREGEFLALLGPNGAGKSTLMYCMLGLLRPTSGAVRLFGVAPELGGRVYSRIGYLPEEPNYHAYLTVGESLGYYAALHGRRIGDAAAHELLERLGLAEFSHLRLAKCSKGMKQKLGIAQCLVSEPTLVFLDEPMRGLDPVTVKQFRDILIEMNSKGATIVMNSHILSEVEQVASRVAILDRGRLVAQEDVRSLLQTVSDEYTVGIETAGGLPEHFEADSPATSGAITGRVKAEKLYDFFDSARRLEARIAFCQLRRATLEESFLRVLNGGAIRG